MENVEKITDKVSAAVFVELSASRIGVPGAVREDVKKAIQAVLIENLGK